MADREGGERVLQRWAVEMTRQADGASDVISRARRPAIQKPQPLLGRGYRHGVGSILPNDRRRESRRRLRGLRERAEFGDGWRSKQLPNRHVDAEGA